MSKPGHPMYEAARWRAARLVCAPGAVLRVTAAVDDYEAWARAKIRPLASPRRFRNAMMKAGFVERVVDGSDESSDRTVTKVTFFASPSRVSESRTRTSRERARRAGRSKVTSVTVRSLLSHLVFMRRAKGLGSESDEVTEKLGKSL